MKKMMRYKMLFLCLFGLFLLLGGPLPVSAHSVDLGDIDLILGQTVEREHQDDDPWKGTMTVTFTNKGDDAWGDFHFRIVYPGDNSVLFTEDVTPTMTGANDYFYTLTNGGLELNYYFYNDPVTKGESATFNVYTDNTLKMNAAFAVAMEASPVVVSTVPLPGTMILFGSGIAGIIGWRRKSLLA